MSTFKEGDLAKGPPPENKKAAAKTAAAPVKTEAAKDEPIDPKAEPQEVVPASDPHKPTELLDETADEKADRHDASTELPVGKLTAPESQADTELADLAKDKVIPGAAVGPDAAGVVLNEHGRVAYAPPGSHNAAVNGVQEDASGHVSSVGTDNSAQSGTRV